MSQRAPDGPSRSSRGTRLAAAAAVVAISAGVAVHSLAAISPFDDAYIIFRYLENILLGRGPVYNIGERVFGISCPLFAAWLLLVKTAVPGLDLALLAVRGNVLFLATACVLVWRLLRRLGFGTPASAIAAGAVAISEGILRASIGGMESSMYLALAFAALLATASRRDTLAVLLASLAALTRPEGLLLLATVIAARLLDRQTRRLDPRLLLGLLPLAVWAIAATAYYGTPIPHSVIAKARPLYPLSSGFTLLYLLEMAGRWSLSGAASAWMLARGWSTGDPISIPLYRVGGIAVSLWSLWRWWQPIAASRSPRSLALPVYLVLLVAFYALSNPLLLAWYMPLAQAPWVAVVLAACLGSTGRGAASRFLRAAMAALVLSSAVASFVYHLGPSQRSLITQGGNSQREHLQLVAYARAAAWLERNSLPSDSIAAPEIGILGYTLDRRILDACGLVSPEALPFLPVPVEERGGQLGPISVGFVRATMPEYVMTLPAFAERSLLRSRWFSSAYTLVHEEPFLAGHPGHRAVLIFKRRP